MSTPAEHYLSAETWLRNAATPPQYMNDDEVHAYVMECFAAGQLHATLACATTAAYMPKPPTIGDFPGGGVITTDPNARVRQMGT